MYINITFVKKIIIFGCGGNSRDILDLIKSINSISQQYDFVGFLDDDEKLQNKNINGAKVIGKIRDAKKYASCCFINGIYSLINFGENERIILSLGIPDIKFATLVHPSAILTRTVKIGKGSAIFQNCSIMSNTIIGKHVNVQPNCVISHDNFIDDYSFIANSVSTGGYVKFGKNVFIGMNSTIRERLKIGSKSIVGMGSVVLDDIPSKNIFVGNPAKLLEKN